MSGAKEGVMEEKRVVRGTDRLVAPLAKRVPRSVKPNHLTYARAAMLAPVVAFLWRDWNVLAVVFLGLAVFLDILDGAVARLRGEQSANGEWLDAYADKVLIVGLLIIYGWDHFPAALVWAIVGVEVCLSLGRPIKIWLGKSGKANSFGKMKMWCQSAGVIGLAAGAGWTLYVANFFLWAALGFAVLSVIWHIRDIFARSK